MRDAVRNNDGSGGFELVWVRSSWNVDRNVLELGMPCDFVQRARYKWGRDPHASNSMSRELLPLHEDLPKSCIYSFAIGYRVQ